MHLTDWSSTKQGRVCYSPYGAEILACTDADDRGFYLKTPIQSILEIRPRHVLVADSKGLFDTITKLHHGKDYRLRQTVQQIRDSFDSQELDLLRSVQGKDIIAYRLTKCNPVSHRMLDRIATDGRLSLPKHHTFELDSKTWV